METLIKNQAVLNGLYNSESMIVESTVAEVTLVEGLNATKTANRTLWASGYLQYTVNIENTTAEDYENPIFTDELDPIIEVVTDSVKLNGNPIAYTFLSNVLSINLPTIGGGESVVVTFLVQRA